MTCKHRGVRGKSVGSRRRMADLEGEGRGVAEDAAGLSSGQHEGGLVAGHLGDGAGLGGGDVTAGHGAAERGPLGQGHVADVQILSDDLLGSLTQVLGHGQGQSQGEQQGEQAGGHGQGGAGAGGE
jgi:hypothetical protein